MKIIQFSVVAMCIGAHSYYHAVCLLISYFWEYSASNFSDAVQALFSVIFGPITFPLWALLGMR